MGLSGKVPCTNTFSFSDIFKFNPHPFRMRLEFEGLSHGLKTCHRHVFLTAFRVPSEHKNMGRPERVSPYFGASVLIGLFGKCACTNTFSESDIFNFHPHPYGMRLKIEGLSHELRKCPPDTSLPSLRSGRSFESHLGTKNEPPQRGSSFFGARDGTRTHTA